MEHQSEVVDMPEVDPTIEDSTKKDIFRVELTPRHQPIKNEPWDEAPSFIRHGIEVDVVDNEGSAVYEKTIWQRGVWLPIRPFFEMRFSRAIKKAEKIAGALALQNS